ncbi:MULTISPECIES: LysR family transcriptional regulator [Pseudoalteromonas]|uniref:LysR family transcriptional regulator n=1 Tax=Pseudoalteromonas ruthenica TaxID=151081 RepID=A0A0F4PQU6_9GAMM|nr:MULTISPECIES: LysR family transcriptional regulator [Pseudoalteromonas]MCG7543494.1 LysR family transcriptional regulator [Pseudoalteromonas sp. MM17-2]MCG7557996.1 LysR family transcriptional regulator [Pseudoalteromonas sp. CNAT2-18.1]KJY96631.1 LysR family transcriptional regulator [Pseudoalteromonas ruthenica]KJY98502.1 LysR family transcriptional regulator [Pseudoalteromonas ruthenica]MCF2862235.1 LysR family transcriptional regulator [Pseudoalteromonas sp. CNAT2-18]
MRFEQLKQFLALGSLRHFRQAAEKTNISTSALTRSIQTLEEEVGHQLVSRSTRSVILTKEGEVFLRFCQNTLDEYARTKQLLDKLSGKSENRVVIGYTSSASSIVPMSCGQFMAQHPEVKIEMQLQDQQELHSRLKRGEIDIFVSEENACLGGSDIHLPDQLVLFASRNHPLAHKASVTLHDLDAYPLFGCFSQSQHVQSMIKEAADVLRKGNGLRLGSLEEVINAVTNGQSIAIGGIEHTNAINNHDDLICLQASDEAHSRLIVKTQEQLEQQQHIIQLLDVIEQVASARHLSA